MSEADDASRAILSALRAQTEAIRENTEQVKRLADVFGKILAAEPKSKASGLEDVAAKAIGAWLRKK